jgi:integrase
MRVFRILPPVAFTLGPLWASTARELKQLTRGRPDDQKVFLNRHGRSLTRFGIHDIVTRYVRKLVSANYPALRKKRIGPHLIRHTTATHLRRCTGYRVYLHRTQRNLARRAVPNGLPYIGDGGLACSDTLVFPL